MTLVLLWKLWEIFLVNPSIMDEKSIVHQVEPSKFTFWYIIWILSCIKISKVGTISGGAYWQFSTQILSTYIPAPLGTLHSSHTSQHTRHLTIFNLVTIIHTFKVVKITTLKNRKSSKEAKKIASSLVENWLPSQNKNPFTIAKVL